MYMYIYIYLYISPILLTSCYKIAPGGLFRQIIFLPRTQNEIPHKLGKNGPGGKPQKARILLRKLAVFDQGAVFSDSWQ